MSPAWKLDQSSLPLLPPRAADSHKGSFGRVLLIGGSQGMSGAIALAGQAALRSGAGLVQLALPQSCWQVVAAIEPSYTTLPLPEDADGHLAAAAQPLLAKHLESATSVACGPGLGRSTSLTELVVWLYAHCPQPLVLDADALNALADRPEVLAVPGGPRVLTPHPGEFARLCQSAISQVQSQRADLAAAAALRWRSVVVLKGAGSCISDGTRLAINPTGNPGMATGGSGDVLTGVVAALLGQGLDPYSAARLAAHVHGLAGDLAAAELGQLSLIASDLLRFLPAAFLQTLAPS